MPKPFFIARPAGLFVRFLVPSDLRQRLGVRFIVRRIYAPRGDHARLAAARMGAALSEAFELMRRGVMADFDIKDLIDKHRRGELRDLTVRDVLLPDGTRLGTVDISTPADLAMFHSLRGTPAGTAPAPAASGAEEPAPDPRTSMLFDDAFDNYRERRTLAELTGDVDLQATQRIFSEMNGNKRLLQITDDDILAFEKATANWPKGARKTKRYKNLTTPEIIRDSQARQAARDPDLKLLSDNARRKHRDNLAAFFNWAVSKKKLAVSPMQGDPRQQDHRIERVQVRRPYRADELAQIFDPTTFGAWAENRPHYYWAPWLALYTGARLNEIAQLYLDDIQPLHKIQTITIAALRKDQKVKGTNSVRVIPIARQLLDAGFMTYVAEVRKAGHFRLFPHLKYGDDYGDYLGDRFIVYLKSIGLKVDDNPDAPGMGFHWFRHTVGHAVVSVANANLHTAAGITGHASRSILPGELATYVQPSELRAKWAALNKLKLPLPPPYVPESFAVALTEAHALPAKWKRQEQAKARAAKEAPEAPTAPGPKNRRGAKRT